MVSLDNKGGAQEALISLKHATDQGIRFVKQDVGVHVAHALIEAIAKQNERRPDRSVLYLNYSTPDPALTNKKIQTLGVFQVQLAHGHEARCAH